MDKEEYHKKIWNELKELATKTTIWEFKKYPIVILFYRYISENIRNYINEGERKAGNKDFDYAEISDEEAEFIREDIVKEKGFFILPSELFYNIYKYTKEKKEDSKENLNEMLEKTFNNIEDSSTGEESEQNFKNLLKKVDFNNNILGDTVIKRNVKLIELIQIIGNIYISKGKNKNIDTYSELYSYLTLQYAINSVKSSADFYTPSCIGKLLSEIVTSNKISVNKIYDPACGSGALLLEVANKLGNENMGKGLFGQEINSETYDLCRINMFLNSIEYDKFNIAWEDTLLKPQHWYDEPFEIIVSNPPYGKKWVGENEITLINDRRYSPAGVLAPTSKSDYAFIMHSLAWLATNGTASIVCFPGIFYRAGAEQKIREYLVNNNFIDTIIQLPKNLFLKTPIGPNILILKKNKIDNKVFFIDASKEYKKESKNNTLDDSNIDNIVNIFKNRENKEYISRLVSIQEIEENDYNLSVSTYIEKEDTREEIDIEELNAKLKEIIKTERTLSDEVDNLIREIEHKV